MKLHYFFSAYCCALKAVESDFVFISVLDNEVFNALTLGNIFAQLKEIELHSLAEFNGYNTLCFATVVRFNSDYRLRPRLSIWVLFTF